MFAAIANTRLLEETRRRLQELETLNSIGAIVSSQADLYSMLAQAGDKVLEVFGVTSGYIGLYDSLTRRIEFPYCRAEGVPAPAPPVPLGQGLPSIIIETRRPLLINQNARQALRDLGVSDAGRPALSYLGVPIIQGDEVIGLLTVQSLSQEGLFDAADLRLLSIIGASLGVAIENARLFQQTQTALAETEALYQASADLSTAPSFAALLTALRRHSVLGEASLIQCHYFERPWAGSRPPATSDVIARFSLTDTGEPPRVPQAVPAWMRQHFHPDLPVLVEEVGLDPRLDDAARAVYLIRYGAQSAAFVPLVAGGDWVGYLAAFFPALTGFAEAEARRLMGLARQAAVQAENFRTTTLMERRAQQLITASEVGRVAASLTSTEELITQIVELIRERFSLYYVALFLLDDEARWAVLVYATGEAGRLLMERGHRLEVGGHSMVGWAVAQRRTRIAQDVAEETIRFVNPYLPQTRSEMALPLIMGERVLGALSVQSSERQAFGDAETMSLQIMADQIAIAIRNAQALGDLRLAVQALDYERFLLQTLLENVPDRIVFKDQHGRYLRVSRAAARRLGQTPEALIGRSDFDFMAEAEARRLHQTEQELMRTGQPVLGRLEREAWAAGPEAWLLTSQLVLRDAAGRPAGTFGVARDVTELKQAQEEAQRRVQQLLAAAEISRVVTSLLDEPAIIRQAVELIRDRFDLYYVALFLLDDSRRWAVLQHAAGAAATGPLLLKVGHRLEVGGHSLVGLALTHRQARRGADLADEAARFANPLTPETRSELALPLQAGDMALGVLSVQSAGRGAFAEADLAILQTMADQIAGALQNARLYTLQRATAERLLEVDRLKTQFLANMSHELRTPLNSIIGFSRVILKGIDGPINDIQRQDLTSIHASGQHLLGLINDILDLSRIEAGKMELSLEAVALPDLFASVLTTTRGLVKDKPIEVTGDYPADLPPVRADGTRLRQVLLNLLSNAAKFTDQGRITLSAAAAPAGPDGRPMVEVRVADTGQGIAPADMPKLFERFSQVDGSATRKAGGTGLGLHISRHLLELHGGRLWAESAGQPGAGAVFHCTLPVDAPPEPAGPAP